MVAGQDELQLRDRMVLGALVVRRGTQTSVEEISDALWGAFPPPSSRKVVQGAVMQLRRALGGDAIVTASGTYRLAVPDDDVDLACFEHAVGHARETLAVGHPDRAAHEAADALALWRGSPFAELGDWAPAVAEATRLEGVREQAEDL
jgi:DNA-binding SARP family transcriptional activator